MKVSITLQAWAPAITKALLLVMLSMASVFLAGVKGKTAEVLSNWNWLDWLVLVIEMSAAGIISFVAFLDRTIEMIRQKFGDTAFLTRGDTEPIRTRT